MNKRAIEPVIVVLIVVGIVLSFFVVSKGNLQLFSIAPSTGAVQIQNPLTGGYDFNYPNNNSFPCDADECIVSGSMDVSKNIGGDGLNWYCDYNPSSTCTIAYYNTKEACQSGSRCTNIQRTCPTAIDYCTSIGKPKIFSATFNFCPNNDLGFAYCSGTSNTVTTQGTAFTTEKLIKRDEIIRFNPLNGDNSPVESFNIKVQKYDLSCSKNLISPTNPSGTTCSLGQKYCTPVIKEATYTYSCPPYTHLVSTDICSGDAHTDIAGRSYPSIKTLNTPASSDYTKYKQCGPAKQTFGQSQCTVFDTTLSCATGQNCYLFNSAGTITSNTGTGLGDCSCPNGVCANNQRKKISETEYQQCISVGSCLDWSSTRTCAEGLIFYETRTNSLGTKGDCICNPANSCSPNETECISKNSLDIRQCGSVTRGDKTCSEWKSPTNCLGDKRCFDRNDALKNDICSCETINKCTTSQIKCIDINNYKSCSYGTDSNSCLDYRGSTPIGEGLICDLTTNTPKVKDGCKWDSLRGNPTPTCTSTQQCVTNDPSYPDGICKNSGCAYDTSGTECSNQVDLNNQEVESCDKTASSSSYNTCAITRDSNTATAVDMGKTRCNPNLANQVQKVTHYSTSKNPDIYRWEKAQDCTGDFFCVANGNIAVCNRCSALTDSVGNLFESRSGNQCVLNVNEFTASADLVGRTKCSGSNLNTVYYVKTYTDTTIVPNKIFYRWEPKTDETNSVSGVCMNDFFCSYNENTKLAKCDTSFNYIGIVGKVDFAVGENIGGFTVIVKSTVPNYLTNQVNLFFFDENNVPIGQLTGLTLIKNPTTSDGERLITSEETKIKLDRPGIIKVTAISGDIATSPYKISKNLNIQKTLELRFGNCPLSSFLNRPYTCTWKAVEKCGLTSCNEVLNANYEKVITPEVPVSNPSSKSVTITPNMVGDITIKVTASALGFLSDTKEFKTNIQDTLYNIDLYLDDKPSSSYITGITQGTHELKLKITESGVIADIQRVDFTIKTPTGAFDNLNFIQNGDYWRTNYDFKDAGRTYTIGDTGEIGSKDDILLKDYTKQGKVPSVAFSVSTSQTKTEDLKGELSMTIIYIAVGVFVFIVFIILLAIMYKRRLKSATGISVANQTI